MEPYGNQTTAYEPKTTEHILQFFAFGHLPTHLQEVSKPFADLAQVIMGLPRNPERTVALRKLLESKDAAVRAKLAKEPPLPDVAVTVNGIAAKGAG